MLVGVGGNDGHGAGRHAEKCRCPCTGRIGSLHFENIPCLVSESENADRKTRFTVEAISLDGQEKKKKRWIGINQTAANDYFAFFLKKGLLAKMVPGGKTAKRERTIGRSRIDFETGGVRGALIEIKTMLMDLPCLGHVQCRENKTPFTSVERLVKHFNELARSLKTKRKKRALVVLCYLYDAKPFAVPKPDAKTKKIQRAARAAQNAGVENWQANFVVDAVGVRLARFFKLKLF